MFADTNATPAHEEQGEFALSLYHSCVLVPSPYETGPAYAVVPRRGA
ncbi:hypothetical protein [Methanofollis formosanus]|nr:hypothetical protein [Methanofollis formosanus]